MQKILPITDLLRQAGQIVKAISQSDEPVIITQRGRPAAVLISAERYRSIEEDLGRLDELEMEEMVREARRDVASGNTISHGEVKRRISSRTTSKHSPKKRSAS